MNITWIAFDWMHRSWKWSQIKLLKEYLENNNINNIVVRGEYYRHWSWNHILEDPYSAWRQKNIFNTNYQEKSNRLNRELYILYNRKYPVYLKNNNIKNWVIIQDRSIIWNYLFSMGEWEKINNNINRFNIDKKWVLTKEVIIPQLIFILQPSQEVLLKRLYEWYNKDELNAKWRLKYKEEYINEKYGKYYDWYNILPEYIKDRVIIISWDQTKEEIHTIIIKNITERIHNIFWAGV